MLFTVYFSESGAPRTSLVPKIGIWRVSDGVQVIGDPTPPNMTEIAAGFYKYDFAGADTDESYVALADSVTLFGSEQYADCITTVQGDVTFIRSLEGNNWEIVNNQMIFYDTDGTTPIATFNLFDAEGAPAMEQVYKREIV